eukprot:768247-Rhodomonas_salina.1
MKNHRTSSTPEQSSPPSASRSKGFSCIDFACSLPRSVKCGSRILMASSRLPCPHRQSNEVDSGQRRAAPRLNDRLGENGQDDRTCS